MNWCGGAVAVTCRWLATAVVTEPIGRRLVAYAPMSQRRDSAYEELPKEHDPGWLRHTAAASQGSSVPAFHAVVEAATTPGEG